MKSLKAKAYAKVNLFLEVTGRRNDGYHLLDTVMQSVGLYDEIEAKLTDKKDIIVLCDNQTLCGKENIVFKACEAFFEFSGWTSGIQINIIKNIPVAAGLGGGSADAAAVLNMLNSLSNKNYDNETLYKIAVTLGADVPFCITGGTAKATGIGEKLEFITTPNLHCVLLKQGEKKSTRDMYSKIDSMSTGVVRSSDEMVKGINNLDRPIIYKNIYNAFEICWDMNSFREIFFSLNHKGLFLSGSGPTVCALFEDESSAKLSADCLQKNGYSAFYAPFCNVGCDIE